MPTKYNWEKIKTYFLAMDEVQKQRVSLKIRRKMFAMSQKGKFVLKLPKERVTELLSSKKGLPYDPGNGKIMKEWVIIPEKFEDEWISYTSEAKEFALKLAKK